MELTKQTEQYKLFDHINDWVVTGTVYSNVNGGITINGTVHIESKQIGIFNYSKPAEGNSSFTVECLEENRENFASQINILISNILVKF